jgi:hypothetical protein
MVTTNRFSIDQKLVFAMNFPISENRDWFLVTCHWFLDWLLETGEGVPYHSPLLFLEVS